MVLRITDRSFCSDGAMILSGGIFEGYVVRSEKVFELSGSLVIKSLDSYTMLECAKERESRFVSLHVRVRRSTGHGLHMHIVVENGDGLP